MAAIMDDLLTLIESTSSVEDGAPSRAPR
jgi:hypothetical protein